MWMTLGIVFFLLIGVFSGYRRGLLLQLILTIGFVVSYYFAGKYFLELSDYLQLMIPYPTASLNNSFVFYSDTLGLQLDEAFYNGISFLVILFVGWLLTRVVGGLAQGVRYLPLVKQVNSIGGAALGGIVMYVGIFLMLFILTMLPIDFIQNQFANSSLAKLIIEDTPALSEQIYTWWVTTIR